MEIVAFCTQLFNLFQEIFGADANGVFLAGGIDISKNDLVCERERFGKIL